MIIRTIQEQNNLKLDKFLSSKFTNSNIGDIRKFIKNGEIKINKKKIKTNYLLSTNDTIEFSDFVEKILANPDRKITINNKKISENYIKMIIKSIIYEDKNLLVINKPYGISVQGGSGIKISIDDIIKHISNGKEKYRLVHRLDQYTTGVLLIAKNIEYANELKSIFKTKINIKKLYIAVVYGKIKNKSGIINYPLLKKYENNMEKVYVDKVLGKEAITKYKVQKYSEKYNISLVEAEILTGRTHQIRVHLKEIGNPIIGDYKYGKLKNNEVKISNKLQLHSFHTELKIFGKHYTFKAPIPEHMKLVVDKAFSR